MRTLKIFGGERLFIDKRSLTALCAVIILLSLPVSMFASYRLDYGYAMILPSFAAVVCGTLLQECVYGKAGKALQIFLSSIKYVLASAWALYCISPMAEELAKRVEAGLYTGNAPITYIVEVGFLILAGLFMVALVLEICAVIRGEKTEKGNFLFIDKIKMSVIYAVVLLSGLLVLKFAYGDLTIREAGSYPLLIVVPSLAVIALVTALQEIIYIFCRNKILHIPLSCLKWGSAIVWFTMAGFIMILDIVGAAIYIGTVILWICLAVQEIISLQRNGANGN